MGEITRFLRPHLYSREHTSLQAALAAQDAQNIRRVALTGTEDVTQSLSVPEHCTIEGDARNGATVRLPSDATFHAFDLDAKTGVAIRDLQITHQGTGYLASAYGVQVRGDAEDIWLDNIEVTGFRRGINVSGSDGTVAGACRSVHLHKVGAFANGNFGICVDECDVVELIDCKAHMNALDGAKLRRKTKNVTVRGGSYKDNGQDHVSGNGNAGDGIDVFAGGDQFTLEGAVFEGNNGNGYTIKTDSLTRDEPGTYGYVKNIQVANVRCINNRVGYGGIVITFTPAETDAGDAAMPLVANATIHGGEYSGNHLSGLYLNGRSISVIGPIVRGNNRHGILVGLRSLYTTITNPIVAGNSQELANTYHGIYVAGGAHTAIRGGTILGVDADLVTSEADLAALTKYQNTNVYIANGASDVYLDVDFQAYNASGGRGIRTDMTTGTCLIHQRGTLIPNTSLIYGSVGSTYYKTDATNDYDRLWVKCSGAPNAVGVWVRMMTGAVVSALPTAAVGLRGAMLQKQGGAGVADSWHICVKKADESYAWLQVGLS